MMDSFILSLNKSRNKGLWLQAKMYAKFFHNVGDTENADKLISIIKEKNDPGFNVNNSIFDDTLYYEDKEKQNYE